MPTFTTEGQITLPEEVRKALNIEQGDEVVFEVEKERVILRKKAQLEKYIGFLGERKDANVDAIIRELREGY
ncbi:MAG: AbrB/MazE/SpoVT family DNA-binding domain-containing protein [Calditrichaeota bacterium]|nr:AbrB/MazE/SpoVT family DNA-binding domain-containing protein [Calditrichota bacterium]